MRLTVLSLLAAAGLAACGPANFDLPGSDAAAYAEDYPYYAEFCALSQVKKMADAGAEVLGGIGGHAVFYLHGACRVEGAGYPVLQLCPGQPTDGVGVSMNEHFRNAKWVATPGRAFFFNGVRERGGLTRAGYERTQAQAKRLGIYDGVAFHEAVYADMPASWTRRDWQYEVSASTDYAVSMGRGRYCARVPATAPQMARMVAFLNTENAPYRAGAEFRWSLLRDNCIHLAHNALAAAGFWEPLATHQPWLPALLSLPTPRNEFINVMKRGSAPLPRDPAALLQDASAARALQQFGVLPMGPGTQADAHGPQAPNAVYRTDVKLILYDEEIVARYRTAQRRIFSEPRHFDPAANRAHVAHAASAVLAQRKPLSWWQAQGGTGATPEFAAAYAQFYAYVERITE